MLEIDASEFHEFGFSRAPRFWHKHPLKEFAGEKAHGKLAFELQFTDYDVIELTKPLATNVWCAELRLDCFHFVGFIGDKGAEALAQALKENKHLHTMNLRGNRIGDLGAGALGGMLRKNRTLRNLNLDGNAITKQGAIKILSCIMGDTVNPPNPVITQLNLQFNKIPEVCSPSCTY